jgi:hypothetical protein
LRVPQALDEEAEIVLEYPRRIFLEGIATIGPFREPSLELFARAFVEWDARLEVRLEVVCHGKIPGSPQPF